ncbi:unnamed protein product [Chrysoparadoxa australica]
MATFDVPEIGDTAQGLEAGGENDLSEIPHSLCTLCGGEGTTRMLMTKIPFFRELVLCSFECDDCGWTNNEVTFGGEIQPQGCIFKLNVSRKEDLNRQIIKSDYATVTLPGIDFEIPPKSQKGEVTTVEGLLSTAAKRLGYEQAYRMQEAPEVGAAVAEVILKLTMMSQGSEDYLPFDIIIDDPSGNSFVENPNAPAKDVALTSSTYGRTAEQDRMIGLQANDADEPQQSGQVESVETEGDSMKEEALKFEEPCPSCRMMGETLMCVTDIPHFKEIIVMSFDCPKCGYRSNEVKGGGAIPALGTAWKLKATGEADFARDILKSDTAHVRIPEIELDLEHGTLGGMYTTVEGLLLKARKNLVDGNPFYSGDSAHNHHSSETGVQRKFRTFLERFNDLIDRKIFPFTIEITDPLGNSFIGSAAFEDSRNDPALEVWDYERTFQENEDLGLNDIKTSGFEEVPDGLAGDTPLKEKSQPHQHRVGTDHPVAFTKGTEVSDTTRKSSDA